MAENIGVLRVGGELVSFWCPGCDEAHTINAKGWAWDGNVEAPTFNPSIKVTGGSVPGYCCHSFVEAGRIRFLSDCTHNLAGQTVPLEPWPNEGTR